MKKLAVVLVIVVASIFSTQAENQVEVKSKVKAVTVFTSGAQVTRSGTFEIKAGVTEVVFEGVSPDINPASIQAKGRGEFIILDVRHNIKYPEPAAISNELPNDIKRKIERVSDSLTDVNFDLQQVMERIHSLAMEKGMITNNPLMKGEGKSDSIPVLKDAMVLFRERLEDINKETIKAKRIEHEVKQVQSRLQKRLNELRNYTAHIKQPKQDKVQQVIITVNAEKVTFGRLEISYAVSNAGWSPSYDLRAKDINSPVELTYKAQVYQNTGEEWNNVSLTLSSNNPNESKVKPNLPIWYLNYYQPVTNTGGNIKYESKAREVVEDMKDEEIYAPSAVNNGMLDMMEPAKNSDMYSQMVQNFTNVKFDISLPYTIESDGKYHFVAVQNSKLPSKYFHYLVPKLDNDAFLVAKVTDWEKLNLLPGKANIFFDGTYIGQTTLNPTILADTLELALGRDKGINIERKKEEDKERDKLLGSEKIKTMAYEIKIKNKHQVPIHLILEDQIPISRIQDIKVKLEEAKDAMHNDKTGALTWNVNIKGGESKKLGFTYSVTYDGDRTLGSL